MDNNKNECLTTSGSRVNRLRVEGVISKILDGEVEIKVFKPFECGSCDSCQGIDGKVVRLPVKKKFNEGDTVFLEIPSNMIPKLTFLLYFIPAVSVIMGFLTGYLWKGNTGGFLGSAIFMIVSFLLIKKYSGNRYMNDIIIFK